MVSIDGFNVPDEDTACRPVGVREQAESQLLRNSYLALKNVSCDYHEGVLTLRGCLPSYYLKQVAQTAVGRLDGVERVVNQIEVVSSGGHGLS